MGSGTIVNDLAFVYDDLGQLVTEYQEHAGAVNTSTSLKVQYAYDDGTDNNVRLTKMTYPDGRELNYDYGSTGSTDDALSRVASLIDDDGTTHLVDYSYLGAGSIVQTDYAQPDVRCDLAHGTGDDPCDGPMDRFGRVTDLLWYDYGSSADLLRFKHGYDRAGNRLYRPGGTVHPTCRRHRFCQNGFHSLAPKPIHFTSARCHLASRQCPLTTRVLSYLSLGGSTSRTALRESSAHPGHLLARRRDTYGIGEASAHSTLAPTLHPKETLADRQ